MENLLGNNNIIGLEEVVSLLGVSQATIRNWIRHNYLSPQKNESNKLVFDFADVKQLKEKITSGEINRLGKRANKNHSKTTFIPDEYAENESVIKFVEFITTAQKENNLKSEGILLAIALNLLKNKGLISYSEPFAYKSLEFNSKNVKKELNFWFEKTKDYFNNDDYFRLLRIEIPEVGDILGLIYQSLSLEGNKAEAGSYYTPKNIVDEVVEDYLAEKSVILDPCCGTGQFLLSATKKIKKPENLWGFDIDEIAVNLARVNLIAKFPNNDFSPHIYKKNSLFEFDFNSLFANKDIPKFDAVITNPPWGVHFSNDETSQLQKLYPSIKSNEAFSYFIFVGLNLLKKGGILSFILPEAILNTKMHKDIRSVILNQTKIKKIKYLDRVFKNVFTPVIRIDLSKEMPLEEDIFIAQKTDKDYKVEQKRLSKNSDYIFDVFSDDKDMAIFEKVYSVNHTTLLGNADWALGIVSGDNKKYIVSDRTETNEPILTGKNIKRFTPETPNSFIEFSPKKFQQVAPEEKYRAKEKLIYRFISKELVFSYDDKQTLTLNSANIVIPRIKDYPTKSILAFLNSPLYQFLYQKKFGSLKILRGDIEKLPMPLISPQQHNELGKFATLLINKGIAQEERKETYSRLNDYIMEIFSLDNQEREYIKSNINLSEKLLNINNI